MNKTKYIILTLILCFSLAFLVYPLKSFSSQIANGGGGGGGSSLVIITDVNSPLTYNGPVNSSGDLTFGASTNYDLSDPNLGNLGPDEPVVLVVTGGGTTDTTTDTTKEKEKKKYYYNTCNRSGWPWNFTWRCVLTSHTSPGDDKCQTDSDCGVPTPPPPPPPPQYSCKQCRGTTCSVRYSSTPCSNTCTTDADCRVPTPPSNGWTPPVSPPPPPKYSCNKSTWTCYQNPSGPYSSLSSCQSACVEPPCMINYFEFPKRAWVGYSITGKWSASDWCVDCDVTCTPYPECVWKQDNIGTGFDEHEFTLEQSGDYIYTLTCYKQGGRDQKQVTVSLEALNLPWWREIIPVLPGFLRGIWK